MQPENYLSHKCELKIIDRQWEFSGISKQNEETAVKEAGRCLVHNFCDSCDLCRYSCPDLCITRNPNTRQIDIDYDFCKGCGICAFMCPKGAITMEREE